MCSPDSGLWGDPAFGCPTRRRVSACGGRRPPSAHAVASIHPSGWGADLPDARRKARSSTVTDRLPAGRCRECWCARAAAALIGRGSSHRRHGASRPAGPATRPSAGRGVRDALGHRHGASGRLGSESLAPRLRRPGSGSGGCDGIRGCCDGRPLPSPSGHLTAPAAASALRWNPQRCRVPRDSAGRLRPGNQNKNARKGLPMEHPQLPRRILSLLFSSFCVSILNVKHILLDRTPSRQVACYSTDRLPLTLRFASLLTKRCSMMSTYCSSELFIRSLLSLKSKSSPRFYCLDEHLQVAVDDVASKQLSPCLSKSCVT